MGFPRQNPCHHDDPPVVPWIRDRQLSRACRNARQEELMTMRRLVFIDLAMAVVVVGSLLGGCDRVIDKINEHATRPAGGGNAPGPAPTPPPVADASASDSGGAACSSDKDCRLVADYCTGCDCRALGSAEPDPVCTGPGVQCFADACLNKTPACVGGRCVAQAPPPPACLESILAGDDTTCKSTPEWKQFAYDACLAKGMVLTYYGTGGGDCGPDKTHQVKYTCCPTTPTPPPPPPPPGPTPPPTTTRCFGASEGGETSCKPPSVWKQYASDACAKQGTVLTEIAYGTDCGSGNYRYSKYTCCGK
jgi:hypothetical protein